MAKKRQYFPTKKAKGGATGPAREPIIPPSLAVIDTTAAKGRSGIAKGARVTILGTGLYAGETAVVEEVLGGVIPAALVRTEAGRTRRVRTIDLAPATAQRQEAPAETVAGD